MMLLLLLMMMMNLYKSHIWECYVMDWNSIGDKLFSVTGPQVWITSLASSPVIIISHLRRSDEDDWGRDGYNDFLWSSTRFARIFSFLRMPTSEVTGRNSAKFCDMFGRRPYEEVVGRNLGVLPYIVGPKSAYFRMVWWRHRDFSKNIFWTIQTMYTWKTLL